MSIGELAGAEAIAPAPQRAFEDGAPGLDLLGAWTSLEDLSARRAAALSAMIADANARVRGSVSVESRALGAGLFDRAGRLIRASDRFALWLGRADEDPVCRALVRQAAAEGSAIGHAPTEAHGVLALLALSPAPAWPWIVEALGLFPGERHVLMIVFAPSRCEQLVEQAAGALGLAPLERRIAAALAVEPTLESAARRVGVGRETAKDALEGALRKSGADGAAGLVARILDLAGGRPEPALPDETDLAPILGLTRAETRVARRLAAGDTTEAAAAALGMRSGTVGSYRRAIFSKLGIARARDLRRLIGETVELQRLVGAGALTPAAPMEAGSRVFPAPGDRLVACIDHGPPRGRPILVFHGYTTGARAPPPLVAVLAARGRRAIVPLRPGFGLTTRATGDYLAAAVADVALIMERLGLGTVDILARDGGVATALAFAASHPRLVGRGVLINPQMPRDAAWKRRTPMSAITGMLLRHPDTIEPFAMMMLRRQGREFSRSNMRRVFANIEADRIAFEDPATAEHLLDDNQLLGGRTVHGFMAEHRLFAEGWRPPDPHAGPRWRLAVGGEVPHTGLADAWTPVTGEPMRVIEGAGILAQFTHPKAVADLFLD